MNANTNMNTLDEIIDHPAIELKRPKAKAPLEFFQFPNNFDPATIPPRNWVLKGMLLRGFVSALVAPGGVGKSQFINSVGVSISSAIDFLNLGVDHQANVLILNNEDSQEELQMRVSGICKRHNIEFSQITNSLFMRSGYSEPLILAEEVNGTVMATSQKNELINLIKKNNIAVLMIDPFVSIHTTEENKNSEMDKVIGILKQAAKETNTAILLVHHTRKTGTDSEAHAGDIESSRGAKAVTDACRVGLTLAKMSRKSADKMEIDFSIGKSLFRLDEAKQNYAQNEEYSSWFKMAGVQIANNEWIGVPEVFNIKPHLDKLQDNNSDVSAHEVAEALNTVCINLANPAENSWTDIRPKYMKYKNGLSQRAADYHFRLISDNENMPTRIRMNSGLIDFYIHKKSGGKTAPFILFRKEL